MCENNNCSCVKDIVRTILKLQNRNNPNCDDDTCTRPFLGPVNNTICYNTRPISLYSCCNNNIWTFPYTLDDTEATSTVLRAEALDDCCLTCRVLAPSTEDPTQPFVATNSFVTINLNCVGAITCRNDISINLI